MYYTRTGRDAITGYERWMATLETRLLGNGGRSSRGSQTAVDAAPFDAGELADHLLAMPIEQLRQRWGALLTEAMSWPGTELVHLARAINVVKCRLNSEPVPSERKVPMAFERFYSNRSPGRSSAPGMVRINKSGQLRVHPDDLQKVNIDGHVAIMLDRERLRLGLMAAKSDEPGVAKISTYKNGGLMKCTTITSAVKALGLQLAEIAGNKPCRAEGDLLIIPLKQAAPAEGPQQKATGSREQGPAR